MRTQTEKDKNKRLIVRRSPVQLDESAVVKVKTINHWDVVKRYQNEGYGPWISDLSHLSRWDVQDGNIDALSVPSLTIPSSCGRVAADQSKTVCRMNPTQAAIWHFKTELNHLPDIDAFTDVTDAEACLAIYGPHILSLMEKLTSLDLKDPGKTAPFFVQGPICRVPCRVLVIEKTGDNKGVIFSFSRGYAADMVKAVFSAGKEFLLRPAGEGRFTRYIQTVL